MFFSSNLGTMSINLLDFLCPDECFLHDELADDRVVLDDDGNEICPVIFKDNT
jgi:hypothetical protein